MKRALSGIGTACLEKSALRRFLINRGHCLLVISIILLAQRYRFKNLAILVFKFGPIIYLLKKYTFYSFVCNILLHSEVFAE